jgi:hypothetical protein
MPSQESEERYGCWTVARVARLFSVGVMMRQEMHAGRVWRTQLDVSDKAISI